MKTALVFYITSILVFNSQAQWVPLTTCTNENLLDICFVDINTGVASGNAGTIIRTTNSGVNWSVVLSSTNQNIFSLCFPSVSTGYASGQTGFVRKTINSGSSWFAVSSCGINVRSISFINNYTGITGGGGSLMCFTTDGGNGFFPRYAPSPHMVTGVHFVNASLLMVCASDMPGAVIYKSTNTGYNWDTVMRLNNSGLNITYSLNSIYFKDANTGYATGNHSFNGPVWGDIYRSINGGNNWVNVGASGPAPGSALNCVHFGNNLTGFAAGNNGVIMHSTNGGANWSAQIIGTSVSLTGIFMLNDLTGYICGVNGLILKTTNGGIVGFEPISNEIPSNFLLSQNYPNPFNSTTKIRFSLPNPSRRIKSSTKGGAYDVKLIIYDVLGQEVASLIPPFGEGQEGLQPGTYEVEWKGSDYPSGLYYYKLIAGDYSETKKMILIK